MEISLTGMVINRTKKTLQTFITMPNIENRAGKVKRQMTGKFQRPSINSGQSFQELLSQEIPLLMSGALDHGDEDESATAVVGDWMAQLHQTQRWRMMSQNWSETKIIAQDGTPTRLVYDAEGDILEIFFGDNKPATGVELTDHLILRVHQESGRAVSLTILEFSILSERTEFGPRSFPLNKLKDLPDHLRELV